MTVGKCNFGPVLKNYYEDWKAWHLFNNAFKTIKEEEEMSQEYEEEVIRIKNVTGLRVDEAHYDAFSGQTHIYDNVPKGQEYEVIIIKKNPKKCFECGK